MTLKSTILSVLKRDALKSILDALEIDGVDRRSVNAMRSTLSRSRRASAEVLLGYLRKDELQEVCEIVGVEPKGKKEELVGRLLGAGEQKTARKGDRRMASEGPAKSDGQQRQLPFKNGNGNGGKLDVSALENWLWEAACVIRGPLDAPKFKDYILPLIFLKRLSDVFEMKSGIWLTISVTRRRRRSWSSRITNWCGFSSLSLPDGPRSPSRPPGWGNISPTPFVPYRGKILACRASLMSPISMPPLPVRGSWTMVGWFRWSRC